MRILVTGGLGFLGRAVVAALSSHGAEVTVLAQRPAADSLPGAVSIRHADLRDSAAVSAIVSDVEPQAACHVAGLVSARESFDRAIDYFDVNVTGTINLLRAIDELPATNPIRVVFTSSTAVYGSSKAGALSEDDPVHPESPYAASKLAAEEVVRGYARTGRIEASVLRCFNIAGSTADGYGDPDQTRIISAALRAARGEIPHVTVNGDGSAVREFTHVLDVAEAVRLALEAAGTGVFNIGTGMGITMMDVIGAAERVTGRPIRTVHRPPAREPHTLVANATRAREVLGWRPRRSGIDRILGDAWAAAEGKPAQDLG